MSISRLSMLAFILIVGIAMPMIAQETKPDTQAVLDRLGKISQALQLTAEQRQQLLPILRMETPQLQEVMKNSNLPPHQRALQFKQIAANVDGKIQPILTPQQWQKWEIMRKQEREEILQKANEQ